MEKQIILKVRINDEGIDTVIFRKGFQNEMDEVLSTIGVLETIRAQEIKKVELLKKERRELKEK